VIHVTGAAAPPASKRESKKESGEKLKVLERRDDSTKVRDQQGNEGWVPTDAPRSRAWLTRSSSPMATASSRRR
jgi:uncharacterized protein YgiM (DUF1202 family)